MFILPFLHNSQCWSWGGNSYFFSILVLNSISFLCECGNMSKLKIIAGTTVCIIGAASRLEVVHLAFQDETFLTACICTFYELCNTSGCVSLWSLCIVRILCAEFNNFMEERVGERKIRWIVGTVAAVSSVSVCLAIILNGEILSGSFYSLATNQIKAGG